MYPHVFEKDKIEYPACQPEGDIKLRGRSWLWVGSGTEKRLPVFKIEIAVEEVKGAGNLSNPNVSTKLG